MRLDIRFFIGAMFGLLGLILAGYGLITAGDTAMYARSLGMNINLWWGLFLVCFGGSMLMLARIGAKRNSPKSSGA